VDERRLGELECLVAGSGPPLVLLPGLAPENGRPTGLARSGEIQTMHQFSGRFTTYWVGRPVDLEPDTSFADLAAATARALRAEFGRPVDVLGISTGGSLAQQIAAEHPDVVRRLVLMSTGGRLAGYGAATQRAVMNAAARGNPRQLLAVFAWDFVPPWRGRTLAAVAMYALGLRVYPRATDLRDLQRTLAAEDVFDLRDLPTITAPTLIVHGGKDRFYDAEIIRETAALIPGSRVSSHPQRGHITVVSDRRALREVIGFLGAVPDRTGSSGDGPGVAAEQQ
jgi:pimeloyl-ACP methyl ester carboxylesterase